MYLTAGAVRTAAGSYVKDEVASVAPWMQRGVGGTTLGGAGFLPTRGLGHKHDSHAEWRRWRPRGLAFRSGRRVTFWTIAWTKQVKCRPASSYVYASACG